MIAKYAQLTPKERAKGRLESLGTLKRNSKKVDQDVDIEEFLVIVLQAQLAQWTNPDKSEDIDHLSQMVNLLTDSLNRTRLHKVKFAQNLLIPFDCTSQSQNGMHFPTTTITNDLDCQNQTWLPSGANQHMILPQDESHFLVNSDASFSSCPGFSGVVKNQDIDKSRLEKSQRQDEGIREPNFQTRAMDFPINGNFELPRSVYDGLVPTAGSCAISIFNENVIPQPPNQFNAQVEDSFVQHLISNHRHSKFSDDRFSNDA
ncbi:hypothetical protein CDL12_06660 [Handroanthus impetiginosus]|uniref:Uncharacterized protein n=1 Tax=Handroanthus impetiginosus TaxID=429701 RepID=A0A2G9HTL9_9LAMI|nr:hypothetical protein CDL12_06660 [Handroanthus impetiginosus]